MAAPGSRGSKGSKDSSGPTNYRIEALAKGLQVLRLFDGMERSLRITEISQRTGIPLPTAFRIVKTLEEFECVERLPDGSVSPGLAVLRLGAAAMQSSSLLEAADRPLHRLAEITGETVNLGVLTADRVLYVARLRNQDLVTANLDVGSTLPAAYTSMGKLLLSTLEPEELARRLGPDSFPDNAGTNAARDLESLLPALDRIRESGYAIQDEELAAGLRSIAAPVVGSSGRVVAAINIAVSTSRHGVDELVADFLTPLRTTADEITLRLQST